MTVGKQKFISNQKELQEASVLEQVVVYLLWPVKNTDQLAELSIRPGNRQEFWQVHCVSGDNHWLKFIQVPLYRRDSFNLLYCSQTGAAHLP